MRLTALELLLIRFLESSLAFADGCQQVAVGYVDAMNNADYPAVRKKCIKIKQGDPDSR